MELEDYGWNSFFEEQFQSHLEDGLTAARITIEHRAGYDIITREGELHAELSGKLRHQARQTEERPVVGDWVAVSPVPEEQRAIIKAVLPRQTAFSRKAVGRATREQVLATNIDLVFIVSSLERDFNPRRLERYLTLAWESGATPILILNKVDICSDLEDKIDQTRTIAQDVTIHAVSALTGEGMEELRPELIKRKTAVFLGSSGVGKSTLINALSGTELLETQEVRETDQKGRHTTTHRQLLQLPGGGLVIDTPGMREIHLWEGDLGVDNAFPEIDALASNCRFTDCQHEAEPGCAVLQAIAQGQLESARLESYHKLQRELKHLELQQNKRDSAQERKKMRIIHRNARSHTKKKRS